MNTEARQQLKQIEQALWDADTFLSPTYKEPDWRKVVSLLKSALEISLLPESCPELLSGVIKVADALACYPSKEDWEAYNAPPDGLSGEAA